MIENNNTLWAKIQKYEFDEKDVKFTFTKRLAHENNWTTQYTQRTILEYKKFVLLCCLSDTPITPSDAIDQVWHLHLTYTKSYWDKFCSEILQKKLHHNPTKGGKEEQEKFLQQYTHTQEIYKKYFGKMPTDIWWDTDKRFSDINFQRINADTNFIISKKQLKASLMFVFIVFLGIFSIQAKPDLSGLAVFFLCFLLGGFALYNTYQQKAEDYQQKPEKDHIAGDNGYIICGDSSDGVNGDGGNGGDSGCGSGCGGGCGS